MRSSQFLTISCGSQNLVAAHLRMNASGRCDLLEYIVESITFDSTDPLLWLKAVSEKFSLLKTRFPADIPVAVSIPGHLVLTKYLKIPQVNQRKRQKILAYEARQNIPYPINEVTWGDCLIDEDDLDFETVIAATKTDFAEALSRYMHDARLKLDSIEPAFVSMLNGFRFNYPERQESSLIISIRAKSTDLIYVHLGKFYSRNVSVGGESLSREIADTLNIPMDDAEQIKDDCARGEPAQSLEYDTFEIASRSFLKRLATEISRTAAISRRHGIEIEPKECYLSGSGSVFPKGEEILADKLGIAVHRYDPIKEVKIDGLGSRNNLEADIELLGDVVGLGIGQFVPDSAAINLMPRSVLWQRKFRKQQPYFIGAGLVACAAICLPLFNTSVAIHAYEQEIQNLDARIAPILELNTQIAKSSGQLELLQETIETYGEIGKIRSNWVNFMNDIQERLRNVEDVWLDKLEVHRGAAATGGLAGVKSSNFVVENKMKGEEALRLHLEGRLLDVKNPLSTVSQDSFVRVKNLLESIADSQYILSLEGERFDNSIPGILKFDFTLLVDPLTRL